MYVGIGIGIRFRKLAICLFAGIIILLYLYNTRKTEPSDKKTISLKDLLDSTIIASEIGGLQVVNVHENSNFIVHSKGKTKEGINDPVTEADYRSHCAMYESLMNAFPAMTVISEEESVGCDYKDINNIKSYNNNLQSLDDVRVNIEDITVWIDPLDATKEFTENLLQYVTTMVCVAYKGKPIIGVIHKPFKPKATYWAWVDHEISNNLKQKQIKKDDTTMPVLIVSLSHPGAIINASKTALGDNIKVISAAGAGYKVLEVIFGNATAYVHISSIKKWDICAGAAILRALGGKMSSLFNSEEISFGADDAKVLSSGLLATMTNHDWYLNKFLKT